MNLGEFCVLCMQVCRTQRRASGALLDLCLLNLELGRWSASLRILQSLPPSHSAEVTDVHVTMPSFYVGAGNTSADRSSSLTQPTLLPTKLCPQSDLLSLKADFYVYIHMPTSLCV